MIILDGQLTSNNIVLLYRIRTHRNLTLNEKLGRRIPTLERGKWGKHNIVAIIEIQKHSGNTIL